MASGPQSSLPTPPRSLRARPSHLLAFAAALVLGLGGAGCKGADSPNRPLPAYSGRFAVLFDDAIEGAAVGFVGESKAYQPKYDPLFRERAQVADGVLRLRIITVNARDDSAGTSFVLGCRAEEKLAGEHPPMGDFELRIASGAPSAGILRNLGSRVVGMRFVGFVRVFVRPDGEHESHFHFAPNTKAVAEAATDAATLIDGAKK